MKRFLLQREQLILRPVEEVFAFFAQAQNLETITPPWLGFQILSALPTEMSAGTRIAYRIYWRRWPLRWVTEIQQWEPPHRFVDVQLHGPYRHWHHTHTFEAVAGGTRMRDVVQYSLPLGPLGRWTRRWLVEPDLNAIFDYRAQRVVALLGVPGDHE